MLALSPGILFTLALIPFGATRASERPWLALAAAILGVALGWGAPGARWPRWAKLAGGLAITTWLWSALAFVPVGPAARAALQPGLAPVIEAALALTDGADRPLALAPWRGLMEWGLWGALMALAAGTASRVRGPEQSRRLLGWLVAMGVAILFVAWVHRAQGAPRIWWVSSVPSYQREAFFAPFASPNHAGATLAALLPLALGLAAAGEGRRRALALAAAAALGVGVVATGARAAAVDAVAAGFVLAVLLVGPRLRVALLGLGGLALAALPLVGPQRVLMWLTAELAPRTYDAIEAGYSDVLTGRGDLYADAAQLLRSQPWVGVGPGGFDMAFRAVKSTPEYLINTYAHQEPLQIALEHGLPALVLLGVAALALLIGGVAHAVSGPLDEARAHRAALVASIVAISVDAQVDFPLRIGAIATLGAVVTGALIGLCAEAAEGRARRGALTGGLSLLATGAVLALAAQDPLHSAYAPAELAEATADAAARDAEAVTDPAARRVAIQDVVALYQEAVWREPLRRTPLQKLGRAWWALGDLDRAEAALSAAAGVHPTLPWVWRDLARLRERRGDLPGAAAAWKALLTADIPDDPLQIVAEALNVQPDVHAAADAVLPERADRWVTAAVLAEQREDREEAERLVRHAMTLNPQAALELVGMLVRWDRPSEAAALLPSLEDGCRKSLLQGEVEIAAGRYKEAEAVYEEGIRRCGARDRRARFGLGRTRLALGDARGLHALEALVREDPSDRNTLRALVRELQSQGRLLEARQVQQLMDAPVAPKANDEAPLPER